MSHDDHAVATDDKRPAELYCFDCKAWFPKEQYDSPYKTGITPYWIFHPVTV